MKKILIVKHVAAVTLLCLLARFGCPLYHVFGFSCPCCGTTRAWTAFFHGSVANAFSYNAFFLLIPPASLLFAHRNCRFLQNHVAAVDRILLLFAAVLFFYHIGRCTLSLL